MRVAQRRARCGELVDEQRFEPVLREVAERRGRDRQDVVALALEGQAPDEVASELGHPVHRAAVGGVLRDRPDALDVEPDLPPHLEGARVDDVGSGGPLRSVPPLDHEDGAPEPVEEERGGEPDRARSHDEDVGLDVLHQNSPS